MGEQFAVRAAFGNLSAGEHDDLLRAADGGEAVGDDDNGFVLHQRVDGLLHGDFAFGVQRGGGFVQDDDGAFFKRARAMLMRCFSPPESLPPMSPTGVW